VPENDTSWIEYPIASGLMAFTRPQQLTAARASIASFYNQDWPNKQMVVYNTTNSKLKPWFKRWPNFLEIQLSRQSVPAMLQLCRDNAIGEWCFNWLPDAVYDPAYIRAHMDKRAKNSITLLRQQRVYALKDRKLVIVEGHRDCWGFYRFFPASFTENPVEFRKQFEIVTEIDSAAHYVTRFASEIV
jgi:hypothetical protein